MARQATKSKRRTRKAPARRSGVARRGWSWRSRLKWIAALVLAALVGWIAVYAVLRPPTTPYIVKEALRLGGVERVWVPIEDIAPVMARSAVAAEDADFCLHWGFDMDAIRAAIDAGATRGASTISQQTVKNVWLWQGRSWPRKALEAGATPLLELFWSKRRILEVYLNVAEFGEGVFGVEAAAMEYFGVPASALSAYQAALLAAALPNPKARNPAAPTDAMARRARAIADGAATIAADGRDRCFARG